MEINHLNSLRLGFSTLEAQQIEKLGLKKFIENQLNAKNEVTLPDFLENKPRNNEELRIYVREKSNNLNYLHARWRAYFLQRCYETKWPLREKINLFFQNHFVASQRKVRVPYWTFKYYQTINDHAVGNYKDLVKAMVYTNAILFFLDNNANRKSRINENLARELLELFTLGEGNYTESDVRNTALALAGLTIGAEQGEYRTNQMVKTAKTIFGNTGDFIIDDVIDLIFQQKNTPFHLSKKVLQWFFYDNPPQEKIDKYGKILLENKFELKPFFQKMFEDEGRNANGGNQIKNPLVFMFQIFKDLNLQPNYIFFAEELRDHGMSVFNQSNVKGWDGGRYWLTTQLLKKRENLVDFLIFGNTTYENIINKMLEKHDGSKISFEPKLNLKDLSAGTLIAKELTNKLIFQSSETIDFDLQQLLNYEFNAMTQSAQKQSLKAYQYLAKTPEFQLI